MKLQPCEAEALDNAALLIKFAAESPKQLTDAIVLPIATAWDARDAGTWSPPVAAAFWTAYSSLCDLLKPITLDTIAANTTPKAPSETDPANQPPAPSAKGIGGFLRACKSIFGRARPTSVARRSARKYLWLLICLLIVAVIFGFITSTSNNLSKEIHDLTTKGNAVAGEISANLSAIKSDLDAGGLGADPMNVSLDDARIKPETRKKIGELRDKLQDLYYISDTLNEKVNAISKVTAFRPLTQYSKGDLSPLPILLHGFDNVRTYFVTRRDVSEKQEAVRILNGVYAALVPLLFGAIGACTYVLRLTSEQIRDTTFSNTSPIRHFVRISLGALAGLAVGLGGLVNGAGLSAAALAFLAGYAIEPVFATLDGIAEKFRRA